MTKYGLKKRLAGRKGSKIKSPGKGIPGAVKIYKNYDATFLTLLERRQRVQTRTRRTVPLISARTVCRLGSQRRWVWRMEWDTWNPALDDFWQMAHFTAMVDLLLKKVGVESITRRGA